MKTLICRVYETYKHLLMIRSDHPLSPIYSSKNLAKKISRDEERKDKVNLVGEPKKDTAILGRIVVKLEDIGGLYRKLLEEVTELQEDLFGGIGFEDPDWFSFKVPNPLVDEVNNSSAGFCFGDMEMNDLKKYEDVGLRALFHHPRMKERYGCMRSGQFIPNAFAMHDFLYRSSIARAKLTTAIHISIGGPARGTELSANYLRNHPQGDIRNVRIIDGDICLVGGYNKSTSVVRVLRNLHCGLIF